MKRKLLSIILAVFMVFGIIPFTSQASDSRGYTDAYETLTKEMDNKLEDGKEYEFIVEIFENNRPVSRRRRDLTAQTYSSAARRGRELSLVEKRINDQNEVLADIFGERQIRRHSDEISYSTMSRASSFRARNNSRPIIRDTEQLKTMPRYKALLNGFALKMTYAEAKQVAMLPNVKAVTKAVEYKMPEKPLMDASKKIIHADYSTEKGYDGRGRVVAILDTGADVNHPDFRLSENGLKAPKYTEDTINEKIKEFHLWGEYKTEKIPYAYNYADRSFDILDKADHGQHIAGTIAGNALDQSKGVVGVVPEAQLLVMRVFPIGQDYTDTAIYAEAIDDAVILGADSINMSLGSFAGSEDADKIMTKVVQNANKHGSIVCIAGGNDGYQFSKNHYQPSDILDFATVGAPATMKESLSVASFNNTIVRKTGAKVNAEGDDYFVTEGTYEDTAPTTTLDINKEYELVFVGKGVKDEDYKDKNVEGKIVIAERGAGSFGEKAAMAAKYKAAACIIGYVINPAQHQKYKETYGFTVQIDAPVVPTYAFSNEAYVMIMKKLTLEEGKFREGKISFKEFGTVVLDSINKNTMSDFSSWGPTPGLGIKPEITAPGGDIWSTANNNGYQSMSGTSMATPHVAAGIAAVRGKLAQMHNLGLKEDQIAMFVKKVLMNTAKPARTLDDSGYFSVRNQGAGIMDLKDATSGKYVTVEDNDSTRTSFGDAKIEFKQIQDTILNVNVKLQSYLDEKVKYNVSYVLQTDDVNDKGSVNLDPDEYEPIILGEGELGSIELGSKESKEFAQSINWQENQILSEKYPKGYFVDGYLFFTPEGSAVPSLTIPMLAFKGNWDNLPVFEKFIHEYDLEKERPLWLPAKQINEYLDFTTPEGIYNAHINDINATMLLTNMVYVGNYETYNYALGRDVDGKFTGNLAISPGVKDKSQDSFQFKGVFLRNWDDFYLEILDKDEKQVKKIENPYSKSGAKSGLTVNETENYSYTTPTWDWDGTDAKGNQVAEGEYFVKIHAKMQNNPNAKADEKTVKVSVDNTKPTIEEEPKFDENGILKVKASDKLSGIKAVYYTYETEDEGNPDKWMWTSENNDGSYYIEGCEKEDGTLYLVDWAGNITKLDLSEKGKNVIKILRNNEEFNNIEIAIYDEKHNKMTNLNALEDGKYRVEALNIPEGVNVEINPTEIIFGGTDGVESPATVNVNFTKISQEEIDKYGTLNVNVVDSGVLWDGFTVFAVSKDGKKYQLYTTFNWGDETYGAKMPAGEYTILVLNSNGEEINYSGAKTVVVNKQDTSWGKIRFLRDGELEVSILSEVPELITKIKKLGKLNGNEYTFNAKDVFKIYDSATGKDLFEDKDYYKAYFKPLDNEQRIDFWIPADGDYTVELINDVREYLVKPTRVDAKLFTNQEGEEHKRTFIYVYKPKTTTATLKIKEELVSGETSVEPIKAAYHLYDDYGKEIEPTGDKVWANLQAKFYTLEVESLNDKLVPEKKAYDINAVNYLDVEQIVRWKDISTDPVKRYASLAIGTYGEFDEDDKNIQVFLKNRNTKEEIVVNEKIGEKGAEVTVPLGSYDVTLTLPDNTIIDDIFIYVDENPETKEKLYALDSKFNVTFVSAFNKIEIKLKKQKRDFGEVNVVSSGLQGETVGYKLSGEGIALESNDGIFKNLEPGKYTLTFKTPEGYEVKSNEIEVNVEEGKVNKVYVNFNKKLDASVETHRASIKAAEVNEKGKVLRDLDLKYVAIAEDRSQYSIDKIPANTKVKLVEVGLPDGFERKDANDEYITFDKNKEFNFEYVNTKVIPANENETKDGYVNITFDAADNGVLNAPGFNDVKKLSYLVKEAYQVSDFEFYIPEVIANKDYEFKNWDKQLPSKRFAKSETLVAQYEYNGPVVPTPTPTPTPDEPIIPEPDYPIIPDYPVIPHRPHRPTTPTVDIVKEPTKPTETVKPVEEKKDYGIVETMPTIAATFSDLPENAAAGSIMNMVARGVLKGMDNGKFEGELPITRAMVATVLKRLSKDQTINNVKSFTDVKDKDWFADAVKWAQSQGLIKGYEDGTFKANNLVTRQELAIIVERFLKTHGITMDEVKELSYKDLDTLPTWSRDAIIAMAKIGLIEGQTEEMYNPASQFTREELAVMLEKIIIWVEKH